ncbi:MAG: D-aminoacyl-tRNA deacylase [Acidobacteria bacterium]|nr:D-aminoacyl-tRNA deacylase [Acidobacteriota bacterium]
MRAVIQRVREARVRVDGAVVGEIGCGLLALIGVANDDGPADVSYLAAKIRDLRVFDDEQGKMNLGLTDVGGAVLAVSQITLYGDCRRGRRPSFDRASAAEPGRVLFDAVVCELRDNGVRVDTGTYQAHMAVELVNDGPVTILLDSRKEF